MIGYVENDGGRKDAGFKGKTGDCVVRAIAIVIATDNTDGNHNHLGEVYQDVYRTMAQEMDKHGFVSTGNGYQQKPKTGAKGAKARTLKRPGEKALKIQQDVLQKFGFRKAPLGSGSRPTYSEAFERYGPCIVSTTRHMAAIVDGALHDLFDGRIYKMESVLCDDCVPAFGPKMNGGGSHCDHCKRWAGEQAHFPMYEETRERKAMSVWILGG